MTDKRVPLRTCISCRKEMPKKDLYRIVKNSEGEIYLDKTGKGDGRGAYICNAQECFVKLKKAKLLNKVFKCNVESEIYEKIEEALDADK